jgi:hypothetical protein
MPDLPVLIGWLLVGWCGTPWRPRWPVPPPPPDGNPWMRYVIGGVIGAVGGVIGGYVFGQLFGADLAADAGVLLSLVGAFAGGRILGDVAGLAMPGRA